MRFAAALSGVMDRKRHLESGSCHRMGDVVHLQQLWGSALSSEKRDFLRIPQVTAWVSEEEGGAAEERGQFLCVQAELLLSSLSKLCSRVIKVLPSAWQCFPRCLRMWPPHWHPWGILPRTVLCQLCHCSFLGLAGGARAGGCL